MFKYYVVKNISLENAMHFIPLGLTIQIQFSQVFPSLDLDLQAMCHHKSMNTYLNFEQLRDDDILWLMLEILKERGQFFPVG